MDVGHDWLDVLGMDPCWALAESVGRRFEYDEAHACNLRNMVLCIQLQRIGNAAGLGRLRMLDRQQRAAGDHLGSALALGPPRPHRKVGG